MSESNTTPTSGVPEWRKEHVRRYQASNGEDGHIWNGVPTLLLTTTGRKSGQQFTAPLIYGRDGDRYLIVGSRGGADTHPQWYLNILANPDIEVQVAADKFKAKARAATSEEKPALWQTMVGVWATYEEYRQRTSREIPVVIIERV